MTRKYIIVADDSIKGFDAEIAKLEREWGAEEIEPSEDCISRQAVKDILNEEWTKYIPMELDINLSFVLEKINELPPVTPIQQPCEDYLKKRDKDYVHYNVKWLLDNWKQELEILSEGKIKK